MFFVLFLFVCFSTVFNSRLFKRPNNISYSNQTKPNSKTVAGHFSLILWIFLIPRLFLSDVFFLLWNLVLFFCTFAHLYFCFPVISVFLFTASYPSKLPLPLSSVCFIPWALPLRTVNDSTQNMTEKVQVNFKGLKDNPWNTKWESIIGVKARLRA